MLLLITTREEKEEEEEEEEEEDCMTAFPTYLMMWPMTFLARGGEGEMGWGMETGSQEGKGKGRSEGGEGGGVVMNCSMLTCPLQCSDAWGRFLCRSCRAEEEEEEGGGRL